MTNYDNFEMKAVELVEMARSLGRGFDVCIDKNGGYVEVDGITIHFNDDLKIESTEISL